MCGRCTALGYQTKKSKNIRDFQAALRPISPTTVSSVDLREDLESHDANDMAHSSKIFKNML